MTYITYESYPNQEVKTDKKTFLIAWGLIPLMFLVFYAFKNESNIAQNDLEIASNYKNISTCEEGKKQAQKDIANDELRYIFGGFGSRSKLAKNLKRKKDIDVIHFEGLLGFPNSCYNDMMQKEIKKQYGNDIFTKE